MNFTFVKTNRMTKEKSSVAIPDEIIMEKIYMIRSKKVMLDKDLSELYNVDTKQLKGSVRQYYQVP